MSGEDTKKNIAGALMPKHIPDDRKPSPTAAPAAAPPPPKKVIIKSADMMPDMQKEAVDIAVNVSSSSLYIPTIFNFFPLFLFLGVVFLHDLMYYFGFRFWFWSSSGVVW